MKSSRVNYFLVGSFVLLGLVGVIVGIATLSGRGGETEAYYTIYNNVSGIKVGTRVLYEGFHIGEVNLIEPEPKQGRMQFRVDFSVREGWKIPKDSVMSVTISGLLSPASLTITAGESKKSLKPGSRLAGKVYENVFLTISSIAQDMKNLNNMSLKPLLSTVNKTVGSFGDILEKDGQVLFYELGNLVRDLSKRAPLIVNNVEQFSVRMNKVSGQLDELISRKNRIKFEGTVEKIDVAAGNFFQLSQSLGQTQTKLDSLLTGMNSTVGELNTLVGDNKLDVQKTIIDMRYVIDSLARHIDSINQNMEEAARNMKVFSRQIRQNPGLLLSGVPPEESIGR